MTRFHEACRFADDSIARLTRTFHHPRDRLTRLRRTSHDLPSAFAVYRPVATAPRSVNTAEVETQMVPRALVMNARACEGLSRSTRSCALPLVPPLPNARWRSLKSRLVDLGIPRVAEILETRSPTSNGGRSGQAYTKNLKQSFGSL